MKVPKSAYLLRRSKPWLCGTDVAIKHNKKRIEELGIFHSPVYTFFKKTCIIELNADAETGNSKLGNASISLYFSQFQISNFKFHFNKNQ